MHTNLRFLFLFFNTGTKANTILLSTEKNWIEETNPNDEFWANGKDGCGKNIMGKMLMYLRDSLQQHSEVQTLQFTPLPSTLSSHVVPQLACVYEHGNANVITKVWKVGDVSERTDVLVRIHDACFTSELFFSAKCDCSQQLEEAQRTIIKEERGVVIHLSQEGRGVGPLKKIEIYQLQVCLLLYVICHLTS
jgi:GTP cyclohydrolase II